MRNRGITIELTALLDVILTIMFLFLVQNGNTVSKATALAEESRARTESLIAEVEAYKNDYELLLDENGRLLRQANGRLIVEENSSIISLSIKMSDERRYILVEEQGKTLNTISLDWQNRNYASNALNAALSERIVNTDKQAVFIIFEYNRNIIYYSDYSLVMNVIQSHKQDPNVYTAEYDINLQGGIYDE